MATRTLSTADERREAVLHAAESIFAERGIHGTPTAPVAKAAGISQAYLFRLFPTKEDLAIALVARCNARIVGAMQDALHEATAEGKSGEDVLAAMGEAYTELLQDRQMLLLQLHAHAAAVSIPGIRDGVRATFADITALLAQVPGLTDDHVQSFFATGMLLNVIAALDLKSVDEPWAKSIIPPNC
jgi:AcrR family transcriptional regulator